MDVSITQAPAGKVTDSGQQRAHAPYSITKEGPRRDRRYTRSRCVRTRLRADAISNPDKIIRMIRKTFFLSILVILVTGLAYGAPGTMRVDYYHTGTATQESFSLDRIVIEPLPWPGHPQKNIDETNLGKYIFEVRDRATNRLLYSRGFASIYGEWETTDEAKTMSRSFSESFRFPQPDGPVQIVLKKRDATNAFREIWSTLVDPKDMFVDTSRPPSPGPLIEIQKSGD